MKIGIITFHRAHNYGAVLQCYALQEYLKSQGHSVSVIDYEPRHFFSFYNWFLPKFLHVRNPMEFMRRVKLLAAKKKRYDGFNSFIEDKLQLCIPGTVFSEPFDLIIIGSDQVWNYSNGFDPYYWGAIKFPPRTAVVSYAASMPDRWDEDAAPIINDLLLNFSHISVRESALRDSLALLTGRKDIQHSVDPTLLLSQAEWSNFAVPPKIDKRYLLFYLVEYNRKAEEMARRIAEEKKLKLVYLATDVDAKTSPSVKATSPAEFVGLFKYADFVVSASFHGTVFCLQFKKPFISFRMGLGRDSRVESLLKPLGLLDHFTQEYDPRRSYSCDCNEITLCEMKQESYNYIRKVTQA